MRKIAILLLTMLAVSTVSFGQNGQYDVRLQFNNYDCDAQELFIDVDVKASSVDNTFRIAEQNYRFSFNASAIDDVRIVSEGMLSGYIESEGDLGYSSYSIHNIEGTLGNVVSYNIELTGGDGVPIDTAWVNVGTLAFHIFNPTAPFELNWSTQSDFPPTTIIGKNGSEPFAVPEGVYISDISIDTFIGLCTSCVGDVVLTTQQEIDDFAVNYPNCGYLLGDVKIGSESGSSDITNLDGLSQIAYVGGLLELSNTALNSLNGLHNLITVDGRLHISGNTVLNDITAIEDTDLSGIVELSIFDNPNLAICDITSVCNYLQELGEYTIYNNATGCESFDAIMAFCTYPLSCSDNTLTFTTQEQVDDFVANNLNCNIISGNVIINSSAISPITNLNGLNEITSIGGNLEISSNDLLADLTGLSQLTSIGGDLTIELNHSLTNLDGLNQLTSIEGNLNIQYNFGLTNLTGLNNLTALSNRLDIRGNTILDDISAIENTNLSDVYYLRIHSNPELAACNVTSICNYIQISQTASIGLNAPGCDSYLELYDYCNFPVYCSDSTLRFTTQLQIDDFAENNPACTDILGNVIINSSTNFPINNLNGLSSITSIGGDLVIEQNPGLSNLEGLNQLTSIGDELNINYNSGLISLTGLNSLATIGNRLDISHNVFLNDISAIGDADLSGMSFLRIVNNANLSVCNFPSVCSYIQVWQGGLIASNDPGCDSYTQVYERCSFPVYCSDDFLIFTTQKQVDDFAVNNPDCTEIPGNVIIDSSTFSSITNLNGLSQVTSIVGSLEITGNPSLADLAGLTQLTSIGGGLYIENNSALTSLTGLNNLTAADNTIRISDNAVLSDISSVEDADLSGLSSLSIFDNPNLSVCGITSICNYIQASGEISIYSNAAGCDSYEQVYYSCNFPVACSDDPLRFTTQMQVDDFAINNPDCSAISGSVIIISSATSPITNLDGLIQITSIEGDLIIEENPMLQNLEGLNQLTSIGGSLTIDDNHLLTGLSGLDNLTTIGDRLRIRDNLSLSDISAIEQTDLSSISLLAMHGNSSLSVCDITSICNYIQTSTEASIYLNAPGCENYVQVYDSCNFPISCSNASLIFTSQVQIDSFAINNPNCISVPGNVEIRGDIAPNSITNLDGLAQITSIGGNLRILDNTALTNLDGLSQLTFIGGNLDVSDNTTLINLDGFNQLNFIGGHLRIRKNSMLNSLEGLSQLTSVGGDLTIMENSELINLSGLDNLTSINGRLYIAFNWTLTSIEELISLDYTTITDLVIIGNFMLSNCDIEMICNYIRSGGDYFITNNATGCSGSFSQTCGSLPVEMISPLSVRLENQNAVLTWRTETETNNSGFEIQRSQDGANWERIGWQAGQGTTNTPNAYTHVDENPHTSISYYRLKQVDFDGQFSYSNVVSLEYSRPQVNIFPNPVKDKLYIHTNGYTVDNVLVFNTMGQQINAQFEGNAVDVSLLSVGLYTIKVAMGEQYFYEKIVVK